MKQRTGGGFAVGAGDGHNTRHGVVAVPFVLPERGKEKPDVIVDGHARVPSKRDHSIGVRIKVRDTGADDQAGHVFKRPVAGQIAHFEPFAFGLFSGGGIVIPNNRNGPAFAQRARSGQTATPQTQNSHLTAFIAPNRYHRPTPSDKYGISEPSASPDRSALRSAR